MLAVSVQSSRSQSHKDHAGVGGQVVQAAVAPEQQAQNKER